MASHRTPSPNDNSPTNDDSISIIASSEATNTSFVQEVLGNLFDAPNGSALIHACNCQGLWGAGIALRFRNNYPSAFAIYAAHCRIYLESPLTHHDPNRLPLGTALIIPPQEADIARHRRRHWVVCLFTSRSYGRNLASIDQVLSSTRSALQDMSRQLAALHAANGNSGPNYTNYPTALASNRFNSGLFQVPWGRTVALINEARLHITVYFPRQETPRHRRPARLEYPGEYLDRHGN